VAGITGASIEVLSPQLPPEFPDGSDDNGIVLRLATGNVSFLLTGDITARGEFTLTAGRADLRSTVYKAAHHGSANSNTAEFLGVVRPLAAVISVGKENRYGHPVPEVISRLAVYVEKDKIFRTDEDGTVEFITDAGKLWVRTWK
jgi:competence protein ComEC